MPNTPSLDGKPDELVYTNIRLPLWLKVRAVKQAQNQRQDLSSYVIALLVADLGAKK